MRTDPTVGQAPRHLAADHRHGHAGHRRAPAHAHHAQGRLRRGVLHRRDRARARTSSARCTAAGRSRRARSRTSAPACGSRASSRFEQTVDALVDLARRTGRSDDPVVRRKIAQTYELASSLRSLGYQGFASFAQGSSAPEHSYMKMATSEAGKAAYELGMEIAGPYGAVTDDDRGQEAGRWVTSFFVSFANTDRGRIVGDPAQHHRPARAGPAPSLTRWTSPSPTTSNCCARPRASCSTRSARRRSSARTSTTPTRTARCGSTSASTPRSASARPPISCLFLEETGKVAAPGPFFATAALFAPLTGEDGDGHRRDRRRARRVDAERRPGEDVRARSRPRRTHRDHRRRPDARDHRRAATRPRSASSRPSTSRAASSSSTPTRVALDPQPLAPRQLAAWLDRAYVVARGRDGRHRAPDLRR